MKNELGPTQRRSKKAPPPMSNPPLGPPPAENLPRPANISPEEWFLCQLIAQRVNHYCHASAFCVAGEVQWKALSAVANVSEEWLKRIAQAWLRRKREYLNLDNLSLLARALDINITALTS